MALTQEQAIENVGKAFDIGSGSTDAQKTAFENVQRAFSKPPKQDTDTVTGDSFQRPEEIKAPAPVVSTEPAEVSGFITGILDAEAKDRERDFISARDDYVSAIAGAPSEAELQAQARKDFEFEEKQAEVTRLSNLITAEQEALRKVSEKILTSGTTKVRAQQEIAELERKSVSKQADYAIQKLVAQGDRDAAQALVNRQVDLKFGQQERELNALQFMYNDSKDFFTKAEQRAFEEAQTERRYGLEEAKAQEERIQELKLAMIENGAPGSVIASLTGADYDRALQVAAPYLASKTSSSSTDKVYSTKDLPPDLRSDIITNLSLHEDITLEMLAMTYPEVDLDTLRDLMDTFGTFDEDDGPGIGEKLGNWWDSARTYIFGE